MHHIWFIAIEEERVVGFMPVEIKDKYAVINNYYIDKDDPDLLAALLREVIRHYAGQYKLQICYSLSPFICVCSEWLFYNQAMEIICKNGTPTTRNPLNVYEQAQIRLEKIFGHFDNIYVSFSGGKDSGVLLQLCTDYIRKHCPGRKIGVFHLDYEIQYGETIRYVDEVLASNSDIFEVYRVCVPFKVSTCTSMFQKFWRPWDEEKKDCWVRSIPEGAYTRKDFPFFPDGCGTMIFSVVLPLVTSVQKSQTDLLPGGNPNPGKSESLACPEWERRLSFQRIEMGEKVGYRCLQCLSDIRLVDEGYMDCQWKI